MRRSVLFTRFFGVVILAILVTALFTSLLYTYISRSIFTQIKENEMLPKARALGRIATQYRSGQIEGATIKQLIETGEGLNGLLDAYVLVTDEQGQTLLASELWDDEREALFANVVAAILAGQEVRTGQVPALSRMSMVVVGTPIEEKGTIRGAVIMMMPLYEALAAMEGLSGALLLSLLLSLPFVAILAYYAVGRIVKPLKQMRDVAIRMAGGNFQVRADDLQRGEVGQLARSLNHLARELSRSMSALMLERNRLQQVVDGLNEGIVAVDTHMNITHHNPAVARMFQGETEDVDDPRLRFLPDPSVWSDFQRAIETGEERVRPLARADRTLRLGVTPLRDETGAIAGAVGLFTDITESERLERTRRDYVANVSHEMRTPLTAMRALLEPLGEGMVTDPAVRARYYAILLRETLRLSRLINDLMELSRLQSGTLSITAQSMRLKDVLEDIGEKYSAAAEEHGLHFAIEPSAWDCPTVWSNPDRVEEVLVILLDNAMKYTPEGGQVTISAQWDGREARLSVADTGVGIDPEDQPYVFDRFYKVDKAHSGLGSGLGLSIAAELLQWMNEKIWLESEPGKGTTITFTLKRNEG